MKRRQFQLPILKRSQILISSPEERRKILRLLQLERHRYMTNPMFENDRYVLREIKGYKPDTANIVAEHTEEAQ